MKRRDVGLICLYAAATLGVSLALFLPSALNAVDQPESMMLPPLKQPVLKVGTCTIWARWDTPLAAEKTADGVTGTPKPLASKDFSTPAPSFLLVSADGSPKDRIAPLKVAAGEIPALQLVIHNEGPANVSLNYTLSFQSRTLSSPMARMMPTSKEMWKDSGVVAAPAGNNTVLPLPLKASLAAGTEGYLSVTIEKQTMVLAQCYVPAEPRIAPSPAAKPVANTQKSK
ncbi:MAG: hypothetical protein WCI73_10760 [Phycisphaerae bacterium]